MQKVFVTGANGLVGSNLCHRLTELGYDVVAMVREKSNLLGLKGFKGKIVYGDILDEKRLTELMEGADYVFNTAGLVSFDNRLRKKLFRVNVEGTRNVMNAALQAGVKKVVHTSSVAAIGIPPTGDIADEAVEYNRFKYRIVYDDSKHFGEVEVRKAVERGLDAIIANPGSVMGQRDVYFHSGVLLKILKGRRTVPYVVGGMCSVCVDDVVDGEIAALKMGRTGERYILGGENLTFKELFRQIGEVVGASAPNFYVPIWAARAAAWTLEAVSNITGKPPVLTKAHVASATLPHYFSFEKAKRELGYQPRPIKDAIRKSYEWYLENNLME
ncbi:MAG: SDR family oxidoreductase [Bacteroidetes bacterium]|nr:SDR family oxidoreductase [Bacteroidota bacterium]